MKIGCKINGLTMISEPFRYKKRLYAKFKCECGNTKDIRVEHVISGNTKYCGCHQNQPTYGNLKHGLSKSRLNNIWYIIKARCLNSSYKEYHLYGGRGIEMCDEWKNNFMEFYNWAINNGYSDNLSIDRIDVNKDYTPSNCRWATVKEQANNKRNNINITINGKTQTLAQWCEELDLNYCTVRNRIKNLGWDYLEALGFKERKCNKK